MEQHRPLTFPVPRADGQAVPLRRMQTELPPVRRQNCRAGQIDRKCIRSEKPPSGHLSIALFYCPQTEKCLHLFRGRQRRQLCLLEVRQKAHGRRNAFRADFLNVHADGQGRHSQRGVSARMGKTELRLRRVREIRLSVYVLAQRRKKILRGGRGPLENVLADSRTYRRHGYHRCRRY